MIHRVSPIGLLLLLLSGACARNAPVVATSLPSREETLDYLRVRLVGWSWSSDAGAFSYTSVTLDNCLLTITERQVRRDGKTHFLRHEYPLDAVRETEWFPGLLPAGSLQVVGKGVRLRWDSEAAPRYTNVDYLGLPPEFGEQIANAVNHLANNCSSLQRSDPFK